MLYKEKNCSEEGLPSEGKDIKEKHSEHDLISAHLHYLAHTQITSHERFASQHHAAVQEEQIQCLHGRKIHKKYDKTYDRKLLIDVLKSSSPLPSLPRFLPRHSVQGQYLSAGLPIRGMSRSWTHEVSCIFLLPGPSSSPSSSSSYPL